MPKQAKLNPHRGSTHITASPPKPPMSNAEFNALIKEFNTTCDIFQNYLISLQLDVHATPETHAQHRLAIPRMVQFRNRMTYATHEQLDQLAAKRVFMRSTHLQEMHSIILRHSRQVLGILVDDRAAYRGGRNGQLNDGGDLVAKD